MRQREVIQSASGARPLPRSAQAATQPIYLPESGHQVGMIASFLPSSRARGSILAAAVLAIGITVGHLWTGWSTAEEMLAQERLHTEQLARENNELTDKIVALEQDRTTEEVVVAGKKLLTDLNIAPVALIAAAVVFGCLIIAMTKDTKVLSGAFAIGAIVALFWFGGAF